MDTPPTARSTTARAHLTPGVVAQACAGLVAVVALGGCVRHGPTDLRLVAVERVERATEQRPPGSLGASAPPGTPMLKITFASRVDLLDYARDALGLGIHAEFCHDKDKLPDVVG